MLSSLLGSWWGFFNSLEETSNALRGAHPPLKHALVVKIGFDDKIPEDLEWLGGTIEQETA
ncbi:MAG: hypothetical protein ACUVQ8_08765 [Nitrososphaeria archaeon]